MLKKTMKGMRQHFIGAVTDKHLRRRSHAIVIGNGLLQAVTVGVRVQAQAHHSAQPASPRSPWARAIGVFVGIELDQIGQLRLLTRAHRAPTA